MSSVVLLAVILIFVTGYAVMMQRGAGARRSLMTRTARALGLRYSPTDPFGIPTRFSLPLFGHPKAILATHEPRDLMFGTVDELAICMFDVALDMNQIMRARATGLAHRSEPEDSWADFESTVEEHDAVTLTCGLFQVDLDAPTLRVEPTLWPGVARVTGSTEIRFESGDFNDRFSVHCADHRFANAVLDARMLELFLGIGTAWALEMSGACALLYGRRSEPKDRAELIAAAKAFTAAIPRAARSLYPPDPERLPMPWCLPSSPA